MSTTETSPKSKKPKLDPTTPEIPNDIIFLDILPNLPAKSLVRFKSVAPHWYTFISSAEFVETMLSLSSRCVLTLNDDLTFFTALDYYDDNDEIDEIELNNQEFGKDFKRYDTLCSSSNGLVFLVSNDEVDATVLQQYPNDLHKFVFNFVVYNPVLGDDHFIEIPHPIGLPGIVERFFDSSNYNFGFGYVSCLDDFFIVVLEFPQNFEMVFYVYSLRSRRWDIMPGVIDVGGERALPLQFQDPWYSHTGTLVNETLYWGMAQGDDIQFIFAYNLEVQNHYELIDLPYDGFGESRTIRDGSAFSLCCLDGSLCAWASDDHTNTYEMWMFEELVSGYSWVYLFSFAPDYVVRNFFGCNKSGLIMVFKDNGELILADFLRHPPGFTEVLLDEILDTVDYVPSLVSVPNIAAVKREQMAVQAET